MEIKGKYNTTKVFTNNIEATAIGQILELCNQEFSKDSNICIMPDVHAGKGCVIGTTMTIKDKVVPSMVGVDIGCGMLTVELGHVKDLIDFKKLDDIIIKEIPTGTRVHSNSKRMSEYLAMSLQHLKCKQYVNMDRTFKSVGTLGGGNHFIELDIDSEDNVYLIIHSGSRNLGKQIAEYYQELAIKANKLRGNAVNAIVTKLKNEGRANEIENIIKEYKQTYLPVPDHLAYIAGSDFDDYMNDMQIATDYASENRAVIAHTIIQHLGIQKQHWFETIHNYISKQRNKDGYYIIRKGAVAADRNKQLLIPLNMQDGSLLCFGKGNPDWNYSAPHGAGRILSRSKAKELLNIEEFKNDMKNVYSSTVVQSTIDESPRAYKNSEEIINAIQDTCEVYKHIKPIYNFKSADEERIKRG